MNALPCAMDQSDVDAALLKQAMRRLVGGVVVVTAGSGEERVGLTATSVTSLSV
ncbi:MAG TPA: flavin reductase, partial [Enterovirga sp.]|nr:flavin reductase [Enterovirga sp.]